MIFIVEILSPKTFIPSQTPIFLMDLEKIAVYLNIRSDYFYTG